MWPHNKALYLFYLKHKEHSNSIKNCPTESEIESSTKSSNSEGVVVQTNRLEALNLETIGILNIETGGFDKNMWNGTAHPKRYRY